MKKFLIILGVLALVLVSFLAYEGIFNKAVAFEGEEGGYQLMGIDHKGAYKNIGNAFEKLRKMTQDAGIKDAKFAGVYFDDPETVKEADLRSFAAVIIQNQADAEKLAKLEGMHPFTIEKGHAVICDMKTWDLVSTIIAITKAYPALGEYAKKHPFKTQPKHFYELYKEGSTRFVMQF